MGRKIKKKVVESKSGKRKYAPSKAIVGDKDVLTVLRAPITPEVKTDQNSSLHIQIVNGVVCSTGRYSRLYEDYDDK